MVTLLLPGHMGENFESAALGVESVSVRTEGQGQEAMRRNEIRFNESVWPDE